MLALCEPKTHERVLLQAVKTIKRECDISSVSALFAKTKLRDGNTIYIYAHNL